MRTVQPTAPTPEDGVMVVITAVVRGQSKEIYNKRECKSAHEGNRFATTLAKQAQRSSAGSSYMRSSEKQEQRMGAKKVTWGWGVGIFSRRRGGD